MGFPTIKPVINRQNLINKNGLYSIHIRVIWNGKVKHVRLKKSPKINLSQWNPNGTYQNFVLHTHPFAFEINQEIQTTLDDIFKLIKLNFENEMNLEELINKLKRSTFKMTFNQYIKDYIRHPRQILDYATIEKYNVFLKHFNDFNPNVSFKQLNSKLVSDFQVYLQVKKKLAGATAKSYFDKFKVVVNQAEREMLLTMEQTRFLFADVKIKVEKPHRTFLEVNEIQKIINLKFEKNEESLERDRDLFLFQIYTGFYYNDLQILKKTNIVNQPNAGKFIIGERDKNGETAIIPLFKFPKAEAILEKYYNNESDDYIFSKKIFIEIQKYNFKLKKIAKMAGVNKEISNKVARHTNAQIWVRNGALRPILSKMLGHSNETTSNNYYHIDLLDVIEGTKNVDFEKIGI
ncbi:MAG: site-specific integrase [Bacteroidota bacterium]